ncbi:MAG: sigma-70 family RNA polymerase sigma factor [Clostridia bacterium]|nr:sigma-70 family RNA polymerase sigma factor [Clostridia bacterium]
MTDREIIKLYYERNEKALSETDKKFGKYCLKTASRILKDDADAEEACNDALYKVWQSIPPDDPDDLGAYLCRITRNVCVDRLRVSDAEKRGGGEIPLILDELDECTSNMRSAEDEYISGELTKTLNGLMKKLPKRQRDMFVSRYTLAYSVSEIASAFGCGENDVRANISKARKKLIELLRGIDLS